MSNKVVSSLVNAFTNLPDAFTTISDASTFTNNIPDEVWSGICSFLKNNKSRVDLKSVSLACRQLRRTATNVLWYEPKFKAVVSVEQLTALLHKPIKVLHTNDIRIDYTASLKQLVKLIKKLNLKTLKLDNLDHNFTSDKDKDKPISMMQLRALAPHATHIYTSAFSFNRFSDYLQKLIDTGTVRTHFPKLRFVSLCNYCRGEIVESDLERLAHLPVKEIILSALDFMSFHPEHLIRDFKHLKRVVLDVALTAAQIKDLACLPIKVVHLHYMLFRELEYTDESELDDCKIADYNSIINAVCKLKTIEETYLLHWSNHCIIQCGVLQLNTQNRLTLYGLSRIADQCGLMQLNTQNRLILYGLSHIADQLPNLEVDTDYVYASVKDKPKAMEMLAMLAQKTNLECLHVNMDTVSGAVLKTIEKLLPPHKIKYRELPDSFSNKKKSN